MAKCMSILYEKMYVMLVLYNNVLRYNIYNVYVITVMYYIVYSDKGLKFQDVECRRFIANTAMQSIFNSIKFSKC